MIYVSDHGESLGERGLYLHGMPYAIAPKEQLEVPMVWWSSPEFARNRQIDNACLRNRARTAVSHDNLFHSIAGVLDVQTPDREGALDLFAACRRDRREHNASIPLVEPRCCAGYWVPFSWPCRWVRKPQTDRSASIIVGTRLTKAVSGRVIRNRQFSMA